MDTAQPPIDPKTELPPPLKEIDLPVPHDMLLCSHFVHRHSWIHWLPALIGLLVGMFVGIVFVGGAENNRNQINQNYNISPTIQVLPTISIPNLTPSEVSSISAIPTVPVFCTQEAKRCPDGSYVGKRGTTCEFLPCPTVINEEGKFCGGLAGILCSSEYVCVLDGNYPDAGGKCIQK
jgi:hypothetical protein